MRSPFGKTSLFAAVIVAAVSLPSVHLHAASTQQPQISTTTKQNSARDMLRQREHLDPQWPEVQAHMPNPSTASADQMETAADVLRARRFYEDAIDYYRYAIKAGGEAWAIYNKIGITDIEVARYGDATLCFKRATALNKKSSESWNNLGVVAYLQHHYSAAIMGYKRDILLNPNVATFHSNLGTAYFEDKQFARANKEYTASLQIDPDIFEHHDVTGITAHLMQPDDHARFCFAMARIYALAHDEQNMLHYLAKAREAGYSIKQEMAGDRAFAPYRSDPRVIAVIKNQMPLSVEN